MLLVGRDGRYTNGDSTQAGGELFDFFQSIHDLGGAWQQVFQFLWQMRHNPVGGDADGLVGVFQGVLYDGPVIGPISATYGGSFAFCGKIKLPTRRVQDAGYPISRTNGASFPRRASRGFGAGQGTFV